MEDNLMNEKEIDEFVSDICYVSEAQIFLSMVVQPEIKILSDEEYIKQWDARHTIKEVYKMPNGDEEFKILLGQHWDKLEDKDEYLFYFSEYINFEIKRIDQLLEKLKENSDNLIHSQPRLKDNKVYEHKLHLYKNFLKEYLLFNTTDIKINKEKKSPGRKKGVDLSDKNLWNDCIKELTRDFLQQKILKVIIDLKSKSKWKDYHYFLLWDELEEKGHIIIKTNQEQKVQIINNTFDEHTKPYSCRQRNRDTAFNFIKGKIPDYKIYLNTKLEFDNIAPYDLFLKKNICDIIIKG